MASAARSSLWGTQFSVTSRPRSTTTAPRRVVTASVELEGVVVSKKMEKTICVAVTRLVPHSKYHKRIRRTKKYLVHDEDEIAKDGDIVRIVPTRPLSKRKHHALAEILREFK